MTSTCLTCGKPIKRLNFKYCSRTCKNIGISHKVPVVCQSCGRTILVSPSRASGKKYCSRECQSKAYSKLKLKQPNLTPSLELGYFCGLILGDGCLQVVGKKKAKRVTFYSTDPDLIRFFSTSVKAILPEAHIGGTWRRNNGFRSTKQLREVWVYSQALYDLLRPWKQTDFHWQIPSFLTSPVSVKGFLQGIYDTEGGFSGRIYLISKHSPNLEQVRSLLDNYGINSQIYRKSNSFELRIKAKDDINTFFQKIGFRLPRKRNALQQFILENPLLSWTERIQAIQTGMQRAKELGKCIGRPTKERGD